MSSAPPLKNRFTTTVALQLLMAVTGLALVGFIFGHLAGNMLIFAGAGPFNAYGEKLQSLGGLLWVARAILLAALVVHVKVAIALSRRSRKARASRYAVQANAGGKTLASKLMLLSGVMIFCFLLLHLYDFTLGDKTGPASVVAGMNNGESLGLYGLVWNSFANPIRSLVYVIAVCAAGLHLSHALSSLFVTLGLLPERAAPKVDLAAKALGLAIALGFSSIPIYVLVKTYLLRGGSA